jgi:nicotinate-nucleotide adenylyltransferase
MATSDLWQHKSVTKIDAPILQISATYIRSCIQNGKSIKYLVPDQVEALISQKKFYL